MSTKLISVIYFYLVSFVSLMLIIAGIFYSVNYLINITQYDKYPLSFYQENCEFRITDPNLDKTTSQASPSAQADRMRLKECEAQRDYERKQRKIDDLKNSIMFLLVGFMLFGIHFPLARKQTK